MLQFAAENGILLLKYDRKSIALERRTEDNFYVGHPDFALFLLVVIRKGVLTLILPWDAVEPLQPLSEDLFHVGADSRSPETLRFQAAVEGRALRADYSGCPYYRPFTE